MKSKTKEILISIKFETEIWKKIKQKYDNVSGIKKALEKSVEE